MYIYVHIMHVQGRHTQIRPVVDRSCIVNSKSKSVEIVSSLHLLFFLRFLSIVAYNIRITDGNHLVKRFFPLIVQGIGVL
jgi:hypothetical protein